MRSQGPKIRRVLAGVFWCSFLTNNSLSQTVVEISTNPLVVFENQSFEINYAIEIPCVTKYGNFLASEMQGKSITLIFDVLEYSTQCLLAVPTPSGPWALGHFSTTLEGTPAGVYRVDFIPLNMLDTLPNLAANITGEINVYKPDSFLGTGQLYFNHESPKVSEVVSGIGVIRGWACYDEPMHVGQIRYQIDDGPLVAIPYGSSRGDTLEVCNGKIDNGYGAVINWNLLEDGNHTFTLFVDGEALYSEAFAVSGTGEPFLTGLDAEYKLQDFPGPGEVSTVRWSQSAQNFIIVGVSFP